jgi:hypothetical protein
MDPARGRAIRPDGAQIAGARTAANTVADELEVAGDYGELLEARDRVIHSASTIWSIIADVERATSELERRGKLSPDRDATDV